MDIELSNKIERIKRERNRVLALTSDVVFKRVFIDNERVLIKLINSLFELDEGNNPVTIVGYETVPFKKNGKTYRSDLLVKLSDKSYVLLEMNHSNDYEVINRNLIQLVRIHSQELKKGVDDLELDTYRIRGINLNSFPNKSKEPIETFAFCNIKTGKVVSMIYSFCNVDIEKCNNLVYDINVQNLPKAVRWGAIMKEENIDNISRILGEDMLSMEEKRDFLDSLREVSEDERVLNDWVLEKLAEQKVKSQIEYAKDEGIEQGIETSKLDIIKNMLLKNMEYSTISEVTGKTIEEIKKIEDSLELKY